MKTSKKSITISKTISTEMPEQNSFFAEGAVSLRAVLSTHSRQIFEVFHCPRAKNRRNTPSEADILLELCRARSIPTHQVDEAFMKEHAEGTTHGGILARVGEKAFVPPEALCSGKTPFLAYLCGIEDPYNFAACLRTLYAAGCDGVFLPARNWMNAGSVILRASAGASEHLPMAIIPEDADKFIDLLQQHGITPLCAREKRAQDLYDARLSLPLCLIIGGERRGIDRTLDEKVENGVVIPYGRTYQKSLSAQAACAVISFEILRQQKERLL